MLAALISKNSSSQEERTYSKLNLARRQLLQNPFSKYNKNPVECLRMETPRINNLKNYTYSLRESIRSSFQKHPVTIRADKMSVRRSKEKIYQLLQSRKICRMKKINNLSCSLLYLHRYKMILI